MDYIFMKYRERMGISINEFNQTDPIEILKDLDMIAIEDQFAEKPKQQTGKATGYHKPRMVNYRRR